MQWVFETWEDKENIKPQEIIDSFWICRITNKMDGTEDYLFSGLDKIEHRWFS